MEITEQNYKALVNEYKGTEKIAEELTLEQRMQLDQVRLLKSINGKLGFFVFILILSLIVSFINAL